MADPLVSVIIPTFNRSQYVTKAVRSVLVQSFSDQEVIVIDDGSTDKTKDALLSFGKSIIYVYQSNRGVSAARNLGIEFARGKWIAFLDSDDEWHHNYLKTQIFYTYQQSSISIQTADCRLINHQGDSKTYFELNGVCSAIGKETYFVPDNPFIFIINHSPWQVGSTIFLKDAISKAGGFDSNLTVSEDLDLMARISMFGKFALVNKALVDVHRRNGDANRLSEQFDRDLVSFKLKEATIYDKFMSFDQLGGEEKKSLGKIIGAKRRAIGNALRADGRRGDARRQYQGAFLADHSLRSLGRYFLSFLG